MNISNTPQENTSNPTQPLPPSGRKPKVKTDAITTPTMTSSVSENKPEEKKRKRHRKKKPNLPNEKKTR